LAKVSLLAADLDFTILDANRDLPPASRDAIESARAAGIEVVLASGRMASSMRGYAEEADLAGPLISCNGAYVVQPTGAVVAEARVPVDVASEIVANLIQIGRHVHLYVDDRILFAEPSDWVDLYLGRARTASYSFVGWEGLIGHAAHKIIALDDPASLDAEFAGWKDRYAPLDVNVVRSEPEYMEYFSTHADKGTGLAAVAALLGIPQERVAAIGDYFNDIPMLRWAGLSAAVGNAPEEVKAEADVTVAPYDCGGFAEFVRVLVHNSEQ
jgi:Cof subfamily protein (haloacid dehalogenase superfamily)